MVIYKGCGFGTHPGPRPRPGIVKFINRQAHPWGMEHLNPLLAGIDQVQHRLSGFKSRAKEFYFQVLLSQYSCPECGIELAMTGTSECSCPDGHTF